MAAAGHWCNQVSVARNRLPCVGALLSGLELSWFRGTGGLEQRWPLTGSVSVLDVASQPAGALGAGMQRVPVHVLYRERERETETETERQRQTDRQTDMLHTWYNMSVSIGSRDTTIPSPSSDDVLWAVWWLLVSLIFLPQLSWKLRHTF